MTFLVEGDMRLRGLSKIFGSDDLNLEIIFHLIVFKVTNLIMSQFYYFSNVLASEVAR